VTRRTAALYASTSGTPAVENVERRRYDRLREVLGVDGMSARFKDTTAKVARWSPPAERP